MSVEFSAVRVISLLNAQLIGTARAQENNQNIVDNNYIPNLPEGTNSCSRGRDGLMSALAKTEGKRFIARDVLRRYFFGVLTYKEENGKKVTTFDTNQAKYPILVKDLTPEAKLDLLNNEELLDAVFELVATVNTGRKESLYFDPFDGDLARDFDYGSYLYTCGAQAKDKDKNPNADAVGNFHALMLKPATITDTIVGSIPPRKVPVTQIAGMLNKLFAPAAQPAAPAPAAPAAAPKIEAPVIKRVTPPAVTSGGNPSDVAFIGDHLANAKVTTGDDNCRAASSELTVEDKKITFTIDPGKLKPQICAFDVVTEGGKTSANLKIAKPRGVRPEVPTVEAAPEAPKPAEAPKPPVAEAPKTRKIEAGVNADDTAENIKKDWNCVQQKNGSYNCTAKIK